MNLDVLLLVGVLVDVVKKDGAVITGYLDDIGATQSEDSILIADQKVALGITFKGKKIKLSDIEKVIPSNNSCPSF